MNGDLDVQSKVGEGSSFSFSLDIFSGADESVDLDSDLETTDYTDTLLSGKILLVEF